LFGQLRDVIEFFKPYRARLIPLELMQLRNRLFNSIVVEDSISIDADLTFYDYLVGDSAACCADATCLGKYSPREYYDCGSYHDIGAVTDIAQEVQITLDDYYTDYLRCPSVDTTGYVVSEILSGTYDLPQTIQLVNGATTASVLYDISQTTLTYSLVLNMFNEEDIAPSIIPYVITDKTLLGFTVSFAAPIDADNYYMTWDIIDQTNTSGVELLLNGTNEIDVAFGFPKANNNYSISLSIENLVDSPPSYYLYTITEKTVNGFKVKFSDAIDSVNYSLGWTAFDYARNTSVGTQYGWEQFSNGSDSLTIPLIPSEIFDNYTVAISIVNTDDTSASNYGYIITSKTVNEFTIKLTSPTDSSNYYLSWAFPLAASTIFESFLFRQTGQMRDFDAEGTFDCTHGMDQVDIQIEDVINYMLLESGDYILQESGSRILL